MQNISAHFSTARRALHQMARRMFARAGSERAQLMHANEADLFSGLQGLAGLDAHDHGR